MERLFGLLVFISRDFILSRLLSTLHVRTRANGLAFIAVILAVYSILYSALAYSTIEVGNINTVDAGTWSGQILMAGNDDVCVRSDRRCDAGGNNCRVRRNYTVMVQGAGAGGSFVVNLGAEEIPFRLYYNDAVGVAGRVELLPGEEITSQKGAQANGCGPADNGNFSVEFDIGDLYNVSAGDYSGNLDFVIGKNNGRGETFEGQIDVALRLASVVQITGVDNLGLVVGGDYLQGGDDFCVYRNGGAVYGVNVSSSNSAAAGVFTLSTGADTVNYEVFYDDVVGSGSGGVSLTEGVQSGGFSGSGSFSAGCLSQNASIYVRAPAQLFQRFGNYSDTLTIEIIPE